jgi:hypothetical protein
LGIITIFLTEDSGIKPGTVQALDNECQHWATLVGMVVEAFNKMSVAGCIMTICMN